MELVLFHAGLTRLSITCPDLGGLQQEVVEGEEEGSRIIICG